MIISVGSKNPVKVKAVEEEVIEGLSADAKIVFSDIGSDVSNQPKTLEETVKGAMNRAKKAFSECDYSFGIEDGLMAVPHTKTGYMNVCVCAIYDGSVFHLGLSSLFEYPKKVTQLVFSDNIEIDEAMKKAGLTENPRIGYSGGVIGMLTNGRTTRKDCIKHAVAMALIHLKNPELY